MSDYADRLLSDDQIAAMSPAQRKDLIQRLKRPLGWLRLPLLPNPTDNRLAPKGGNLILTAQRAWD
ncbi:MAG: hypothetical protein QOF90_357 [Acetobacteraceae bacterium]|jgi:hypothetical protein|nr:hypothetical protein [Acetobacteraceae bacterium]